MSYALTVPKKSMAFSAPNFTIKQAPTEIVSDIECNKCHQNRTKMWKVRMAIHLLRLVKYAFQLHPFSRN